MRAQRIHPAAYEALTEALARIFWYKPELAEFIRVRSEEYPELVVGLDFTDYKIRFAGCLRRTPEGRMRTASGT